jgi:hypothetical protein
MVVDAAEDGGTTIRQQPTQSQTNYGQHSSMGVFGRTDALRNYPTTPSLSQGGPNAMPQLPGPWSLFLRGKVDLLTGWTP